jgi:hypothetical protein
MSTARRAGSRDMALAAKHYLDTVKHIQERRDVGPPPARTMRAEERAFKLLEAAYVHFAR